MKVTHLAIGLGLLCFGGLAYAADAPQQTQSNSESTSNQGQQSTTSGDTQTVADQSDKDERKICKREPMTGSLIGAKVCKTQKEWDAQAKGQGADF